MNPKNLIRQKALELGFDSLHVTKAERLDKEAIKLREWLDKGYHGTMHYMENHFEKRVDPSKLVPGSRSVIMLTYNYYTPQKTKNPDSPKISIYAYGKDYHLIIREKLNALKAFMDEEFGPKIGRGFVDSAPVLERDLAARAGVGWKGKHTLLIHPKRGSYFFLAALITEMELESDQPIEDYCGTCVRCIEACPTNAIAPEGYLLDANKCISYLTIEHREEIPDEFKGQMENRIFGCDICQDVCPWNRFATPHEEEEFEPRDGLLDMTAEDWRNLDQEEFNRLFKKSAVKRTKFSGLKRNIEFVDRKKST